MAPYEFLIIGSGIAGLSFALHAAEHGRVLIITKKDKADSNTNKAQGGIAAVWSRKDDFDLHIQDTLKAGVGLCHKDAVEQIVRMGPDEIRELQNWGVAFTRSKGHHTLDLGREGGHSKNRIIHARDSTGKIVEKALLQRIRKYDNIRILENHIAIELITEHHLAASHVTDSQAIHCYGIYALNGKTGTVEAFPAHVTLISSGGAGQVYLHTTNPVIASGDGIAMAYRAGAAIANLEFMQFHPTSLYHPEGDSFLISEAVRGFGAVLRNSEGDAFMQKYHDMADLAPRDIVARAIDREMKLRGEECMFLDVTHKKSSEIRRHFPNINKRLLSLKIDMTREPVPVVPAAHYMCGGIWTDLNGRSTIHGLYVTGEAACTGVHGANRLASNSLLEATVFSKKAVTDAVQFLKHNKFDIPKISSWDDKDTFDYDEWVLISHDKREIQRLMWDYVGIVRSDTRLKRAGKRIRLIADQIEAFYKTVKVTPALLELRNIACVANLIIRSALFRKESRGLHYTTDYPQTSDSDWLGDSVIREGEIFLQDLNNPLKTFGG